MLTNCVEMLLVKRSNNITRYNAGRSDQ